VRLRFDSSRERQRRFFGSYEPRLSGATITLRKLVQLGGATTLAHTSLAQRSHNYPYRELAKLIGSDTLSINTWLSGAYQELAGYS